VGERYVALLRGVNVGKAGRLAMADLRDVVAGLGYSDVRTVLNSGNVVFAGAPAATDEVARRLERELAARVGLSTRAIVLTAEELAAAVRDDPLGGIATNPSRLLVAFVADPSDVRRLDPLLWRDWAPEAVALGERVAYLWCPAGVIASPLAQTVGRTLGDAVTTRSWGTTTKLAALASA
jgi:uncharacterized protein (DUF1697 family)